MPVKKTSDDYKKRRSQIIARLAVHWISIIRPEDYGTTSVSAAMDRMMVLSAVEKCESENRVCNTASIQRDVRISYTNVRRALADLVKSGLLTRVDRRYVTGPTIMNGKIDGLVNAVMSAARELTELDGHQLIVGNIRG